MLDKMLAQGFDYWFTNREQVRSPFPESMHDELRLKTSQRFSEWLETIGEEGLAQLEGNEMVEMFEMFLFNVGLSLTEDPDQRITITYPFMPRCGDLVENTNHGSSAVVRREIVEKKDDKQQMLLILKTRSGEKTWQTEFDLPA